MLEIDPLTGEVAWSYAPDGERALYTERCGSCQRLGNVNAAVAKTWSTGLAAEQADADLRDKVYRLGGDTLVILNTDYIERRAIVHGVAFNCGRSQ